MKTIFNWNSLIVLLLIITATCIARSTKNRTKHKYQTDKFFCAASYSLLTICPNSVYGNITTVEPYVNDYSIMIIDMHMILTDITDAFYFHHYRGNITIKSLTNDTSNNTISGDVYFGDDYYFNGTASVCSDDCVDLYFDGGYESDASNGTCHDIVTEGRLCY